MRIALGSDHRGHSAVAALHGALERAGHVPIVYGPVDPNGSDYPDAAYPVGRAVAAGEADLGVLVCGSGIGMSIAANKIAGVRAALACDRDAAQMARRHNDANVLCLSANRTTPEDVVEIVTDFIQAGFDGGRHARRVGKISVIERGEDPNAPHEPADRADACS